LKVLAFSNALFGVTTALVYLSPNAYIAFALMSVGSLGSYLTSGPLLAIMQTIVPQKMRGVSISILYLFSNLVGMGLGPLLVGSLSDTLRPWLGQESLRYALLAMCPGYIWGAWHLWLGARTVLRDIEPEAPEP